METSDGDSLDIHVRPAIDLVRRATVLAAVAERGVLEIDVDRDDYERDTDRFELFSWIRRDGAGTVTSEELRLLATPIGELGDDMSRCDAALTGTTAIAWALGIVTAIQLPVPPDGVAENDVLAWAHAPWTDLDRLARKLQVRDETTIATERERWELWYWRAVDADETTGPPVDVVANVAESGLIATVRGDFSTDAAMPFGALPPDDRDEIAWLAEHRLRALNWVCGFGDAWDSVPLYPD